MKRQFDFVGNRFKAIIFSVVVIVIGLGSIALHGGLEYGIDFTGGTKIILKFATPIGIKEITAVRGCLDRLTLNGSVQGYEKNGILIQMKGAQYTNDVRALILKARADAGGAFASEEQVRQALAPYAELGVPDLVLKAGSVGDDSPATGRINLNLVSEENLELILERALNEELARNIKEAIGRELGLTAAAGEGKVDLNTLADSLAFSAFFRQELTTRLADAIERADTFTSFAQVDLVTNPLGFPGDLFKDYFQVTTPKLEDEIQLNLNLVTRAQLLEVIRQRILASPRYVAEIGGASDRLAALLNQHGGVLTGTEAALRLPLPDHLKAILAERTYASPFIVQSVEMVGPRIGADLRERAIYATLVSLGALLLYITVRFQFKYAVAAIVALIHDTLITIGFMSILGREFDLTLLAALLTIVGFSLNDTVVVYDRIREKLRLTGSSDWATTINLAINETLSRTVITSLTVFFTTLALVVFGGPVTLSFGLAMLVGIVFGTYSSIFIAAPILIEWHNYFERKKR